MPPGRNLTVGQLSDLQRLGDAVRRAGPGDYGSTVLLVVESVRVYRSGGASLTELARALSVEITVLRGWLDQHTHKKPRLLRPENLPDVWAPAAATNQALRTHGVLACTGDTCPGRNDFARELAVIRDRVEPRIIMTERTMIELAELPDCVDSSRPAVLHVARPQPRWRRLSDQQWRADLRTAHPPRSGSAVSTAPPLDPRTPLLRIAGPAHARSAGSGRGRVLA